MLNAKTRRSFLNNDGNMAMISHIEPKHIQEAICEESWVIAMKEELSQFEKNEVWNLVPKPQNQSIIGTRWVFDESIISIFYIIFNLVLSRFKSILFYYYFLLSYLMN